MHQIASALVLSLALAGCATTNPYGNFVDDLEGLDHQRIVSDTVRQLASLYPPAKTRFELQQPTPDAFGQAFVQDLRDKGYALLEFHSRAKRSPAIPTDVTVPSPTTALSLPIFYVLDEALDTNLYRVTVIVGNQSITRAYVGEGGTSVPAGYWVRKE